jgi:hypothetical protein
MLAFGGLFGLAQFPSTDMVQIVRTRYQARLDQTTAKR